VGSYNAYMYIWGPDTLHEGRKDLLLPIYGMDTVLPIGVYVRKLHTLRLLVYSIESHPLLGGRHLRQSANPKLPRVTSPLM
jgi:hypothetical protein